MLLVCFGLFAIRSLSIWPHLSKRIKNKSQIDPTNSTYYINQTGFHEITNVKSGDSIIVKYNDQPLRLFIFMSNNFEAGLKKVEIDGSNILSYLNEKVAFSIDAKDEAVFRFDSIERIKHDHQQKYEKYNEDFDFNFDEINVVLWLLPREMCGKSSIFEYGGNSHFSVGQTASIIATKTSNEITYSNCIFSPLFDIFNSKSSYDISIGVKSNEYQQNYESIISIYTKNISNPDVIVNGNQAYNHTFSKPFFSKYKITQNVNEDERNLNSEIETFLIQKALKTDNFDFHNFDIFCISGSLQFCNTSTCYHDDQIELKMRQMCGDETIWQLIALIVSAVVVFIVLLIIIICLCCIGFCACCGFCCFCCNCRRKKNDLSTIDVSHQSRRRRNPNSGEHDLELPLMSIDQSQSNYHQPVYSQQPALYVVPNSQNQQQQPQNCVYQVQQI